MLKQYQSYKDAHKSQGNNSPSRPVHSLLHFYGDKLSYNAFREFSILADDCKTEGEADLLAAAIITAMKN